MSGCTGTIGGYASGCGCKARNSVGKGVLGVWGGECGIGRKNCN